MKHLGIILTFDHFPEVSADAAALDAQLRRYLVFLGHRIDRVSVLDCIDQTPRDYPGCDLWIVSGSPRLLATDTYDTLKQEIRRLSQNAPVYGLNHGEHVVHDALASPFAPPPPTAPSPRCVRNPFRSFWISDRLYGLSRERRVKPLLRPDTRQSLFSTRRHAA